MRYEHYYGSKPTAGLSSLSLLFERESANEKEDPCAWCSVAGHTGARLIIPPGQWEVVIEWSFHSKTTKLPHTGGGSLLLLPQVTKTTIPITDNLLLFLVDIKRQTPPTRPRDDSAAK